MHVLQHLLMGVSVSMLIVILVGGLLDVPRCRYYDQHCVEMQSAPPLHPHPPAAPPPLSHPACRPFWSLPPARKLLSDSVHLILLNSVIICKTSHTYQLFRPHVVQYPLSILTVMSTLHNGKKKLGGIILWKDETGERTALISCGSFSLPGV